MMGYYLGLGQSKAQSLVSSGLLQAAPFTGPAAPFVAAAGIVGKVFGFGPSPWNVPDTIVTEQVQIEANKIWNVISGENLPTQCDPGRCGKQKVFIFAASAYPNIPFGPRGNPAIDVDEAISAVQNLMAQGLAQLHRKESKKNPVFTNGASGLVARLEEMKRARLEATTRGSETATTTTPGSLLPWALVGGAIYLLAD